MDHASIATEAKVVKRLREKGIKKSDIGREEFLKHAWEWKEEFGGGHFISTSKTRGQLRLGSEHGSPWTRSTMKVSSIPSFICMKRT